MPEPINPEEKKEPAAGAGEEKKEPSQNPVKKELDKIKSKPTQREKILHRKSILDAELAKLDEEDGGDESAGDESEEDDDDKPLTVGQFKKMQKDEAKKSALVLADEIEDEDDRELVKHYLKTRVVPSGNPAEDLKFARGAVSSLKNTQIAEELVRKGKGNSGGRGSGAPRKGDDERFEPTAAELQAATVAKKKTPEDIKKFILKYRGNLKATVGE